MEKMILNRCMPCSKHIIRGLQKELANDLGEYAAKKMKDGQFQIPQASCFLY